MSKAAIRFCFALMAFLALAGTARAQAPDGDDPPSRAGRIVEVIGDAWLFDPEAKEWVHLSRNQTVGEGDRLRTDDRARVALRIGSTSVWLDERSDLEFARLDEGRVLLQLDKGDLGLRLRSAEAAAEFRVQTREGEMVPEREGLYRVEQLDRDRGSRAYVWQGRLRFEPARSGVDNTWLSGGEQAEFWFAGGPRVERSRLESDGFGDWMAAQSRAEGDFASATQRYVSPEMTGAEDLDRYGRWETNDDYGAIWIPTTVVAGWVPYREGRWVWTRHWGWSWVDDMPWGFAPFHYGRWVQWRGRWCWTPGRYVARPVYAPALVAWVGGGSISVGIGIGGGHRPPPPRMGWYPLAPREAFVPAYRHSRIYQDRINGPDHRGGPDRPRHSNRDVNGAISYLPGHGGHARAMPADEVRRFRDQPQGAHAGRAPGRQELATVLPPRAAPETRPAPADMSWRSQRPGGDARPWDRGGDRPGERQSGRDRDRDGDRDRNERGNDRGNDRGGDRGGFGFGGNRGQQGGGAMPQVQAPQPQPQAQPQVQQPAQPQAVEPQMRRTPEHQRERSERMQERMERFQQQQQQQQRQPEAQQPQQQQPQRVERERGDRGDRGERERPGRMPGFERPREAAPVMPQVQAPQPQPQPQAQPQPQRPAFEAPRPSRPPEAQQPRPQPAPQAAAPQPQPRGDDRDRRGGGRAREQER